MRNLAIDLDLDPDALYREASEADPFPDPSEEDMDRAFRMYGASQEDADPDTLARELERLGYLTLAIGARPRANV
jgi:hypothetical protein